MDFVTQTDATEVGNNFPCRKNVLQAMVSNPFMKNLSFTLTTVRKPSNLHRFPNSIALTACFGVTMVFDFQS